MLNQNTFVLDHVHLWIATERKKLTHPLLRQAIPGDIGKPFYFISSLLYPLCSIKEPGIQTLIIRLIWRHQSAIFLVIQLSE